MQFRLLAVRPLEDPDRKYTKALNLNTFYNFYAAFDFSDYLDDTNEVIEFDVSKEINLFDFGKTSVNVSAIAGKNGTGKSTLIELFYGLIFLLSKQVNLIDETTVRETHEFSEEEMDQYLSDVNELNKLSLQVFYQLGEVVYRLTKKARVEIHSFKLEDGRLFNNPTRISATKNFVKRHFFYSVGTNYSLYALNTNESGLWLKPLFHKNDAYQTPLVLNPMRTRGDIDINRVTYLSKSRLLANLLMPVPDGTKLEDSLRSLVNNKIASDLEFHLDESKFLRWNPKLRINEVKLDYIEKYSERVYDIINAFAITHNDKKGKEVYARFLRKATKLERFTLEYILRKTEKIGKTYIYKGINRKEFHLGRPKLLSILLKELAGDYSHITFKIRQAINFLRYSKNIKYGTDSVAVSIDALSNDLQAFVFKLKAKKIKSRVFESRAREKRGEHTFLDDFLVPVEYFDLINFLPPSFLTFDIFFENEGSYQQLSSGERQKVYTISSIIYHLVNLKSVGNSKIKYDYVNLMFDEIELYFHPEFQRTFLRDLLDYMHKSSIGLVGLNLIFITHSPFILSDIPNSNILFLQKIKNSNLVEPVDVDIKTFAANIHELLAGGFFMDHTKGGDSNCKD